MEYWKTIVYHGEVFSEDYEVSNTGRVRNRRTGRILKTYVNRKGYEQVCVGKGRNLKLVVKIHRAVAETFLERPGQEFVVNHKDGVKTNNCVENLEWCTLSENTKHAWEAGLFAKDHNCGRKNGNAVLTSEDVLYIKRNFKPYDPNFGTRGLARRFGVDHMTISRITRGKTWNHQEN